MDIIENKFFYIDKFGLNPVKYYLKKALYPIVVLFYRLILLLHSKKKNEKKYNVTICAIFKNEGQYLKEWIEFHKIVGVDHFYLYNNFSEDNYLSVLKPYIDDNVVTLIEWPVEQGQMSAYKDCITKFRDEAKWIGFIDLDEFVVPKSCDTVSEFLFDFTDYPSVLLYWKVFGTSGLIDRDRDSLVSNDFIVCWDKLDVVGKCFYNTKFNVDFDYVGNIVFNHLFYGKVLNIDLPPVNFCKKFCFWNVNILDKNKNSIQINHYFTKSFMEYSEKQLRGDAFYSVNPRSLDYFYAHEKRCKSSDYSIFKYLIKLKLAMGTEK